MDTEHSHLSSPFFVCFQDTHHPKCVASCQSGGSCFPLSACGPRFAGRGISCPIPLPVPSSRPAVTFLCLLSSACFVTVTVAETSTRESKHHTRRVGELRFIRLAGPEELTLQALSPEQRGYRVFIDRLEWATLTVNRLV